MYIWYEVENYAVSSLAQGVCVNKRLIVENWCAMQLTD